MGKRDLIIFVALNHSEDLQHESISLLIFYYKNLRFQSLQSLLCFTGKSVQSIMLVS